MFLIRLFLYHVVVAKSEELCSAGVCRASRPRSCVAWRQTSQCSPQGRRESRSDRDCDAVIEDGHSGYCECSDGSRARASSCSHGPFTCKSACASFERELCAGGWRASETCDPRGKGNPGKDQGCRDVVTPGVAGYCECGMGRRIYRSGCDIQKHEAEPLVCAEACAEPESLYEIMMVDSGATDQELKKAWRELSRRLHPDKIQQQASKSDDADEEAAAERFKVVREAYDILTDTARRAAYDSGGMALLTKFDRESGSIAKAPHLQAQTELPLETLFHGANLSLPFERRVVCRGCDDFGIQRNPARCSQCRDRCPDEYKMVKVRLGPFMVDQKQRQRSSQRCRNQKEMLDFTVEPGTLDGHIITFSGKASQLPAALNGDLYLKIIQKPHDSYVRDNHDLLTTVAISLRDALIGFDKHITHLGGHEINIQHPGILKPGTVARIPGEGMPKKRDPNDKLNTDLMDSSPLERGDLLVEYTIVFPDSLDAASRLFVTEHFPAGP